MEKISSIVRGNARTASVDLKNSPGVRPGALAFGRPMGESPQVSEKGETTAMKAVAIQNELNDAKRTRGSDHTVDAMADQFFMSRIRRPEEAVAAPIEKAGIKIAGKKSSDEAEMVEIAETEAQPAGFTPRGSYVDVQV